MKTYNYISETSGERLDKFLADHLVDLSRTYIKKLIDDGHVLVNGKLGKGGLKLASGDTIVIEVPEPVETTLLAESISLEVVYEDKDVLVINKPAGLVVHPAPGHISGTLVNALMFYSKDLAGIGGELRPGIVHRLDKDTSGLIVIAKNDTAHRNLTEQMKARDVKKEYLALVDGHLEPSEGIIEAPIGRSSYDRKKMAITARGREAITKYRVERYIAGYTLVRVFLETGRTHQIRVHLSAIGYPVVGDPVYGKKSMLVDRQFLHAGVLGFNLPSTGEYREFKSDLPEDLTQALAVLSTRH